MNLKKAGTGTRYLRGSASCQHGETRRPSSGVSVRAGQMAFRPGLPPEVVILMRSAVTEGWFLRLSLLVLSRGGALSELMQGPLWGFPGLSRPLRGLFCSIYEVWRPPCCQASPGTSALGRGGGFDVPFERRQLLVPAGREIRHLLRP